MSAVEELLAAALDGRELGVDDAVVLLGAEGSDLHALCVAADTLRARQVGDAVTYVVNRNLNFTNVCVKRCGFCAFARGFRSDRGYLLDEAEILRRAREAADMGATELCVQAGLPPGLDGWFYVELTAALRRAVPSLHLHAWSPEEVLYGARRARVGVGEYLRALRDAGLGSMPGTSAEILDDDVRDRIAPGRIRVAEWVEIVRAAHALGIRTTSTMMFGHVETLHHRARHLALLRDIQRDTGGFTEFVPLSFVADAAPMAADGGLQSPDGADVIRTYAVARLMLGADIPNLQASWVKEGRRLAQWLLVCGANDLGGTLMNESISTSAGARHGQSLRPTEIEAIARGIGRPPRRRDTLYHPLPSELVALDAVRDPAARFGTYEATAASDTFRFRREALRLGARREARTGPGPLSAARDGTLDDTGAHDG